MRQGYKKKGKKEKKKPEDIEQNVVYAERNKLAWSIDELAELSSLSRTTIYDLIKQNLLARIKVKSRSIITADAWNECLNRLSKEGDAK